MILDFQSKGFQKQLTVRFADGELFLTLPRNQIKPGRNCINQFRELWNQKLISADHKPFDRVIYLNFENGDTLLLKGFGRFGNLLFYKAGDELPSSIFRTGQKNDWDFRLPQRDDVIQEIWKRVNKNEPFGNVLSFLSSEQKTGAMSALSKAGSLSEIEQTLNSITNQTVKPTISSIDNKTKPNLVFSSSDAAYEVPDNGETLFQFADEYLRWFYFTRQKTALIQKYQAEVRHLEKLEAETAKSLEKVKTRRSFKELGDIILSNAHLIKKGISEAFVPDFYTGGNIRLRLDPDLDAIGNAERYYRKSKNETREITKLEENLSEFRIRLKISREKLLEASQLSPDQSGQLKKLVDKKESGSKTHDTKPYREFNLTGYQVWLGKSAAGNDEMLRMAGKNDLWLHARSVSGSHVIIRKKGNLFPREIIEAAAKLAAKNSRAKHQKVVPVIYTERKYVVKSKGMNPGEVRVLKEQVMDVTLE